MRYTKLLTALNAIPEKMEQLLKQGDAIKDISRIFTYAHNFLYLGRGYNYPVALEGALKLKEISYIHAEGYPAAEMKHGPIALIDKDMPVVFIATNHSTYEKVLSNIQEVKARDGKIIAVISEKVSIRRFEKVEEPEGVVATYTHGGGRIGVLVDAKTAVVNDEVREAVRNVAMQVAALNPSYVSASDVPADFEEHEKEILMAAIVKENEELPENKRKPQQILEKQLIGRLNKELKEICLNDQIYVKAEDGKQTVSQYLAQVGKANNTTITIQKFVRFEVGEGMEKRQENFADEVMSQVKHE